MPEPEWRAYELLVRDIYTKIALLEGVKTLALEHDVTLQGKTTTHQIDVWWKLELAGLTREVIIQAKDWSAPIPQHAVLSFAGVIDDLPARPTGIMISRCGFQSGAQDVAAGRGIHLYELREPIDADLEGLIRAVAINLTALLPSVRNVTFDFDRNWARSLTSPISVNCPAHRMFLEDSNGQIVGTMQDELDNIVRQTNGPMDYTKITRTFDAPMILVANEGTVRATVLGFSVEVSLTEGFTETLTVTFRDLFTYILRSVTDDASYLVDRNGTVRRMHDLP